MPLLVTFLLVLGVLGFPLGMAYGQDLFKFFPMADNTDFSIAVPTDDVVRESFATPEPTVSDNAEPIIAASQHGAVTVVPECQHDIAATSFLCQASKAEAEAGFAIKVPPSEVRGMSFKSVSSSPQLQMVTFEYSAVGGGSFLTVYQSPDVGIASNWGEVPPSASVEEVRVGRWEGEYVRGMFVVTAGASTAVWEPDAAVRRLRWREDQLTLEIRLDGHVGIVEWLDKDTLIELAESFASIAEMTRDAR